MHESVALYTTKRCIVRSLRLPTTITSSKYFSKDVTTDDIDERLSIGMFISPWRKEHIFHIEDCPTLRFCRSRGILLSYVCHVTTAIHRAKDLSLSRDSDRSHTVNTRHVLKVRKSTIDYGRLHAGTASENVTIYIATISKHSSTTTYLTKVLTGLICGNLRTWRQSRISLQLTIAATEYAVHICTTTNLDISIAIHNTCITATDNSENS